MKETNFIAQNKDKWAEYEEIVMQGKRDPERLNELFVQITDDLSYARTFYPNRSVRMYLNGMAQRIFNDVYKAKRVSVTNLMKHFWSHELPRMLWEARIALLLSFVIFSLSVLVGVISSRANPEFASTILGPGYVRQTLDNIANNDPMAIYKDSSPFASTNLIAVNNLRVALLTAISGVLASIGTLFILMQNGVMVGTFQYFFIERGLFWDSFLTIWIHGTLEISMIVVAGAAGLVAGSGLLFPGSYTRAQAFRLSVKRGLKIMFGIAPLIVLAAIFEGFLTRFTETPDVIRAMFILSSLGFVLWYFVWLPLHMARSGQFAAQELDADLPPDQGQQLDFGLIKSSSQIMSDAFTLIRRYPRYSFGSLLSVLMLCTAYVFLINKQGRTYFSENYFSWWGMAKSLESLFDNRTFPYIFYLQIVFFAALTSAVLRAIERERDSSRKHLFSTTERLIRFVFLMAPMPFFIWIYMIKASFITWALLILAYPLLSLWSAVIYFEGRNPISALFRSFSIMRWGQSISIGLWTSSVGLLLLFFVENKLFNYMIGLSIWDILSDFIKWFIPSGEKNIALYYDLLYLTTSGFIIYFVLMLLMCCGAFQYFSNAESADATSLSEGIKKIGLAGRIRGLAKEQ